MEIRVPPELQTNTKRLPPKSNKRGGVGKLKKIIQDHSLYASAAVVSDPSLTVEESAPCKNNKN